MRQRNISKYLLPVLLSLALVYSEVPAYAEGLLDDGQVEVGSVDNLDEELIMEPESADAGLSLLEGIEFPESNETLVKDNADQVAEEEIVEDEIGDIPENVEASSGKCGDNLTWTLDNGVLTISGTGEMHSPIYFESDYYGEPISHTITSVIIREGVTSIADGAFSNTYGSLRSVSIPNSVTYIGADAFHGCKSLTNITIPNSVTSLGGGAFSDSGLRSVAIPDSVTSIAYAFRNCSSLSNVTIPNSVTSIDGAFKGCISLTNVTIPDSVTTFAYTFYGCSRLTSVTIPNSVTEIGNETFSGCSSLINVSIPNSVTNIGNDVFFKCSSLTNVTIPDNISTIGKRVFYGCSNLNRVVIHDNVGSIEDSAFRNCTGLKDVYYYGTPEKWNSIKVSNYNENLLNARIHYVSGMPMFRLFNRSNGEHFYTANEGEKNSLVAKGWKDEGIGWFFPASGTPIVYRLYNPMKGFEEHHYTADQHEIRVLKAQNWNLEGPAWASASSDDVPVYRLFNKAARNSASSHHYTTDTNERNVLSAGTWRYEGIAWYGMKQ